MAPPEHRLGSSNAAGPSGQLRLEPQLELASSHGATKVILELEALLHRVRHAAAEELSGVTALLLRSGHGSLSVRKKIVDTAAVIGPDADADARTHVHLCPIEPHRLLQSLENPSRQRLGFNACSYMVNEHNKLITTQSREGVVRTNNHPDATGHFGEQPVAGTVPKRMVEGAEPVQVDDDNRQRTARAFGVSHRLSQPLLEQYPVGQTGQRVVCSEIL